MFPSSLAASRLLIRGSNARAASGTPPDSSNCGDDSRLLRDVLRVGSPALTLPLTPSNELFSPTEGVDGVGPHTGWCEPDRPSGGGSSRVSHWKCLRMSC